MMIIDKVFKLDDSITFGIDSTIAILAVLIVSHSLPQTFRLNLSKYHAAFVVFTVTCRTLQILDQVIEELTSCYDFFEWHDTQKVDESKRLDKQNSGSNIFGLEGTFKKLDLD